MKNTPLWKRVLRCAALVIGLYWAMGLVLVLFFEDSFIYFPTKGNVGPSPGEDVFLTTSDGVRIHGWYVTHPEARMTILWFHGNAGNLEDRRWTLSRLRALPANVLVIDYRGYGRSDGAPGESGLHRDSRAAYDWLAARTPPEKIVFFGKSLGGAVACALAEQVKCAGLIVQSTFTSAPDMAGRVLPLFPGRLLMRTRLNSLDRVGRIGCPKLFIHSRKDEIIPFAMGERLFESACGPKESLWFDRGGHNDSWIVNESEYYARLARFLDRCAGRT